MKFKAFILSIGTLIMACNNEVKATKTNLQVSTLKSDVLLQSTAFKPFSRINKKDFVYLSLSGKTILESVATFKVTNEKGEELHCETFTAKELIQPEYKTANSSLKETHIREVVAGFFVDDLDFQKVKDHTIAGL
ncbi:MAG: hypothetical protein ABJN95_00775 [Maribacter sp.]|uniref:hypothetical protein n=1 Tax=Maribacter sp. TaxID=1897614 RepID=UPI0032973FB4